MASFEEISVQMVGGDIRTFVARENDCWRKLRPASVRVTTSDNLRGNLPPRMVPAGPWPNVDFLTLESADIGTEVEVEDWEDDRDPNPTVILRLTSGGWVQVREIA